MSNPVQRIDHVVAVVESFEMVRPMWIEAGCPVVYDGTMPTYRACCVSIGSINLELLSAEAFDGWPALANWCPQAGRHFGLQAVALDPGDLDATVTELRNRGLAISEPGRKVGRSGAQHAVHVTERVANTAEVRPSSFWGLADGYSSRRTPLREPAAIET